VVTLIGTPLPQDQRNALAQRDATNVFFVDRDNETVDTISITTGTLTTGPSITGGGGVGSSLRGMIEFDGDLFVAEYQNQNRIYRLDPTSGALTEVARVSMGVSGLCRTPPSF
jgi:hypothetical protein